MKTVEIKKEYHYMCTELRNERDSLLLLISDLLDCLKSIDHKDCTDDVYDSVNNMIYDIKNHLPTQ